MLNEKIILNLVAMLLISTTLASGQKKVRFALFKSVLCCCKARESNEATFLWHPDAAPAFCLPAKDHLDKTSLSAFSTSSSSFEYVSLGSKLSTSSLHTHSRSLVNLKHDE